MDFLEYKKYLIANNVKLFDHDYRISYKNMLSLNEIIFSQNQVGGGNTFGEYYISPLVIIKQDNNKLINLLIDNLIDNNIEGCKYLCNNKIVLKYI